MIRRSLLCACAIALTLFGCLDTQDHPRTVRYHGGVYQWSAPASQHPDRMRLATAEYGTLWKREDGESLVLIRQNAGDLFGIVYTVKVISPNGDIVRSGQVRTYEGDIPYILAELKTDSATLPSAYQGVWTLGVGFWNKADTFDAALPIRFCSSDEPENEEPANRVRVEPVEWDDNADFRYGVGHLQDIEKIEFRVAEPVELNGR